jgi:hypothetical protein
MLKIHDFVDSIDIMDMQDSIALELKLNVTQYGHTWKHIGDVLYNYGVGKADALTDFVVTSEQLSYLKILQTKPGWESCRGL